MHGVHKMQSVNFPLAWLRPVHNMDIMHTTTRAKEEPEPITLEAARQHIAQQVAFFRRRAKTPEDALTWAKLEIELREVLHVENATN